MLKDQIRSPTPPKMIKIDFCRCFLRKGQLSCISLGRITEKAKDLVNSGVVGVGSVFGGEFLQ